MLFLSSLGILWPISIQSGQIIILLSILFFIFLKEDHGTELILRKKHKNFILHCIPLEV